MINALKDRMKLFAFAGNRMKTCFLFLVLLAEYCMPAWSQAQAEVNLENYSPLVSGGPIPEDFIQFYIKKNEFDTLRAKGKTGKQFREENAILLGELFASGKVLLNDPLGTYAQHVLDSLLLHEPELNGKLRVYALRSAEANAFTSNDGKIFITTGFLANLENEAQLAYVLAHEAVHYRNNHLYRDFIFRNNAGPSSLGIFRYSREHESEADVEGLRILMRSKYSVDHIDWVLDVLFNSYLPIDNIPLDRKFFEGKGFSIPDSCILQDPSMGDIGNAEQDYNDIFQTHPSIASRKKEIRAFIGQRPDNAFKKEFLLPQEMFYHIRNIARFELSYLYYLEGKQEESIYNSYVLLQHFPGNPYLEKMMAGALVALASSRSVVQDPQEVIKDHTVLEGYQRQFSYLFSKMSDEQMQDMTRLYVEKIMRRQPGNRDLGEMLRMLKNEPQEIAPPAAKFNVREGMLLVPDITVEDNISRKEPQQAYRQFQAQLKKINKQQGAKILCSLDPYTLPKDSIAAYNDWVLINDWLGYKMQNISGPPFINEEGVNQLMQKYNVSTVALASITVTQNSMHDRLLPYGWLILPYFSSKYSVSYMMIAYEDGKEAPITTYSISKRTSVPFTSKEKLQQVLFGEQ